jgi:4-amino-4-deoxy-L-arabinose transferase
VEGRTGPFYYYFSQIRISYGDLIYLVLIWFGYDTLKNNRSTKRLILFVWIFVPILFFSFAETKMQGYILFISPALFIITGEFWHHLKYNFSFKYKWLKNAISICLILLPIRFTIERIKPFKIYDRNPEWVIKLKNLDHKYPDKTVLFNYNKPIEAMFYTNLTVYPFTPNETELIEIQKKGYTIILNKTEKKAFPLVKKLKYITLK